MANKTIGQLDIVSSVSAVGSYIELEVDGVSKKAYFSQSGTWVPVVYGTTTAGTGTYTAQSGYYNIIGEICFYTAYLSWSAHTGSGNIRISGLPFVAKTDAAPHTISGSTYHSGLSLSAGYTLFVTTNNATDILSLKQVPSGGGTASDVPIDTSAFLIVSGFYFV